MGRLDEDGKGPVSVTGKRGSNVGKSFDNRAAGEYLFRRCSHGPAA